MPRKTSSTGQPPSRLKAAAPKAASKRHQKAKPASSAGHPREFTHEDIARLAYSYWEQRGYASGLPEADWFRAERELRALAS